MKKQLQNRVLFGFLLLSPAIGFAQTLQLGALSSFEAYTRSGNITGPGTTGTCIGDVGTNSGTNSGFDTSYNGVQYANDTLTAQAEIDMLKVYIHLSVIPVAYPNTHTPAFGGGDTLTAGVYSIDGAGSLAGSLTLNGGGDSNAVFIIKLDGAFAVAASSTITLIGGARACNTFWIAEGAISVGSGSVIKGSLFSHFGVVTLGTGCDIEGRMFASDVITFGAGSDVIIPAGPITVPVKFPSSRPPATAVNVLESIENFAMFTSVGAVSNTAASGFIGHIGSNFGSVSGFASSSHIGSFYNADSVTAQAVIDLDSAYIKLIAIPITDSTHASVFGGGDTLNAGVYYVNAAGSLAGTLILDGQNDSDAVFIFRFNGAFAIAAQANVVLINGARACNVFWIAEGALSMGAFTNMKGTALSHNGACSMATNGNFEGRMLSTSGAVSFSTGVIFLTPQYFPASPPLPVTLVSFTAKVEGEQVKLNWVTTAEVNNDYFDVEHSVDGSNFTSISRVIGAGNSTKTLNYSFVHQNLLDGISYYRLKQTDYNGKTSYSHKEAVEFNSKNNLIFDIYPNPFSGETTFRTNKNLKDASLVVYDTQKLVKQIENISGKTFTLKRDNLQSGPYWIKLVQDGEVIAIKKIVITD